MKKALILCATFVVMSCTYNKLEKGIVKANHKIVDSHNVGSLPDCCGTYKGIIPAADCPGINVVLSINEDKTFSIVYDYIDRDSKFISKGNYLVRGNYLITVGEKNDSTYYKVEGKRLRILDGDKQIITGKVGDRFILSKDDK